VTRILSNIKKEQGDVNAACDILCELQVETFGSMSRREKTEFILEQVALCIDKGDWTQAGILSRKISTRYFTRKPKKSPEQLEKERKDREASKLHAEKVAEKEKTKDAEAVAPAQREDDVTDLKLRYYEQQITLAKHEDKYLEVCKHYRQVLDTEAVEEDPDKLRAVRLDPIQYTEWCSQTIRCYNASSTSLFSLPTTTSSPIFSIASTKIPGIPKCLRMPNCSSSLPFLSS